MTNLFTALFLICNPEGECGVKAMNVAFHTREECVAVSEATLQKYEGDNSVIYKCVSWGAGA